MDNHSDDQQPESSLHHLPQYLPSLLGLNSYFTRAWIESVANIVGDLQATELSRELETNTTPDSTTKSTADREYVEQKTLEIEEEVATLNALLEQKSQQKRVALDEYINLKGNIRVFCRIRPFLPEENSVSTKFLLTQESNSIHLRVADSKSKQYNFDKVFYQNSTQEGVFHEIESVIKSAVDGYNVCIFAYGQTGTGKTYTMEGVPNDPGVMPRSIEALLSQVKESNYKLQLTLSMLEIYMGNLRDLLVPQSKDQMPNQMQRLSIKMDPDGSIEIENLVSVEVHNFKQFQKMYAAGTRLRTTASTRANATSSRSHCLIRIAITSSGKSGRKRESNKLWMVDLGGSERLIKTQATGRRLQEGKAINLSLSALGDVIDALQNNKAHVPYRNSKLTQILRDSLGFSSKVLMLVHVSPNEDDLCETICSLGFATRVRSVNLETEEQQEMKLCNELLLAELNQKIQKLEAECSDIQGKVSELTETLEHLKGPKLPSLVCHEMSSNKSCHLDVPKDVNAANSCRPPSGKYRGYMRATTSSRRRIGLCDYPLSNVKKPPVPYKRRPSSVYAESIRSQTQETTWQSDCNSEVSVSTAAGNIDHDQCLQDEVGSTQSEYEIKQVIFPEENFTEEIEAHSPLNQFEKYVNIQNGATLHVDDKSICKLPNPQKKDSTYSADDVIFLSTNVLAHSSFDDCKSSGSQYNKNGSTCSTNDAIFMSKNVLADSSIDDCKSPELQYNKNNSTCITKDVIFMSTNALADQSIADCTRNLEVSDKEKCDLETIGRLHEVTEEFQADLEHGKSTECTEKKFHEIISSSLEISAESKIISLSSSCQEIGCAEDNFGLAGRLRNMVGGAVSYKREHHKGMLQQIVQFFNILWAIIVLAVGSQSMGLGDEFSQLLMA